VQHVRPRKSPSGGHSGHLPTSGRALTISAWLTGVYFLIETTVGLWTGSVAVISDAFHTFSAVGGILVAIVAALMITFTGFLAIDPILGTAFGFVLLWASWGILRDATHLLMDGTPGDTDLGEVAAALAGLRAAKDVHYIHGWALTSGKYVFSAHIRIDNEVDQASLLRQGHQLLKEKFGFYFVTLQPETECLDEADTDDIDILKPGLDNSQHGGH